MNVISAASMVDGARTVLLVLPAAVPLGLGFLRLDPLLIARSRRPWAAAATGGVLGALLVVCVHGLLRTVDPGLGLRASALAWCGGYLGVWGAALVLLLVARRLRGGHPVGATDDAPARPGSGRRPSLVRRWPEEQAHGRGMR